MQSSVSPGFVMVTSLWYTKRERTCVWRFSLTSRGHQIGNLVWCDRCKFANHPVIDNQIFSMFSGVVNYALGRAGGPLATWKYM